MTFITKKHLSRRTFLRGTGVTLALPIVEGPALASSPFNGVGVLVRGVRASVVPPSDRFDYLFDDYCACLRACYVRGASATRMHLFAEQLAAEIVRFGWTPGRTPFTDLDRAIVAVIESGARVPTSGRHVARILEWTE